MDRLEQLEDMIVQSAAYHGFDILWITDTRTLFESVDSDILHPLEQDIGNLRNDLTKAQARIAELEAQAAQQWQPVTQYVLVRDKSDTNTKISILIGGQTFSLRLSSGQAEFFVELPDNLRLCRKVQAAQSPSAQKGEAE